MSLKLLLHFLLKKNYLYHLLIFISNSEQQLSYNLSIFLNLLLILSSLFYKLFSQITVFVSTLRSPPKSLSTVTPNWKARWLEELTTNQDYSKKQFQEVFQKEWEARWQANRQKCSPVRELFCRLLQRKNLKVFKDLRKADASLYLQILSARIGLASFLFRGNVPDFQSSLCFCSFGEKTA